MTTVPASVSENCRVHGLQLLRQGKVRDTYSLPDHPGHLLVVATDRVSIFDHVLAAEVPGKGEVLTALNVFWRKHVFGILFPSDLVACGDAVDEFLPEALQGQTETLARATVVRKLNMHPYEAIVRGYLTGSGLAAYDTMLEVCGHRLPPGLRDGDALPFPIFTPTTKAEVGHDEHMTADELAGKFGHAPERLALQIYCMAQQYARERGIIIADTKFEFGLDAAGCLTVGDEVLTPDSSRYWDVKEWRTANNLGKSPTPHDKQLVREWGKTLGINKRNPEKRRDVAWVHAQEVPAEVIRTTTLMYRYIFWRLTGRKLEVFQNDELNLCVEEPAGRVEVVLGSRSDLEQAGPAFKGFYRKEPLNVHVISCHRNPDELRKYAEDLPDDVIVVAGAGMAAALPGVLKAHLVAAGKGHIPVLGVAFEGKNLEQTLAAALSIEQLPGQSVVLDHNGRAYVGPGGFWQALNDAFENEFSPVSVKSTKPAEFNIDLKKTN